MAQKESTFLSMTLTLFVVTLVAATILGFVHDLTKEDIALAKQKAQEKAIESVLPAFDSLGDAYKLLPEDGADSLEFFPAYDANQQLVGTAVKTYTKNGFSGFISIMAGLSPEGDITGYEVLEHKETPGLGSKMGAWFKDEAKPKQNILGKNPSTTKFQVSKDGGDVDAITASTITSRAFLDAVVRAYKTYQASAEDQTQASNHTSKGGQS
ncbi:RnfABCDGE type electron transport complex subunit G [Sunxiuqinia elliptica]|uniref:Ion-translocating oxidoreductase complex subunit G n=1 Tax=Sunxiuqinia elliptica TaxID=655355 RepID=A0A1I2H733_9BACT|nr:RnfABCDGE type electron transport complex subunit G [Sunxiuqinia elliptica]SFF24441.1 electron transport complex protein RnfG [Sunxiuqinia elliptica]